MSFTKVEATSEMCTIPDLPSGSATNAPNLVDAGYLALYDCSHCQIHISCFASVIISLLPAGRIYKNTLARFPHSPVLSAPSLRYPPRNAALHFLPERLVRLLIFLHPQGQRREFIPLALDLRAQVYHIDDRVKQKHHYRCPDKDHRMRLSSAHLISFACAPD